MSAYVGLAALKEAIGLTGEASDTVDDGVLQSVIYRASALVDNHLSEIRPGYVGFAAGSNSRTSVGSGTRHFDGTGTDWLWIDDADSVASVVEYGSINDTSGTTISTDAWTTWPYDAKPKRALVYVEPAVSAYGVLTGNWSPGSGNVFVTGYWGSPTVPDDIAQVTLALAVLLWRRYQSGDPAPVVTNLGVGTDPEVRGILDSLWPRWGVAGVWGG